MFHHDSYAISLIFNSVHKFMFLQKLYIKLKESTAIAVLSLSFLLQLFEFGDKSEFKLFGEIAHEIFNWDTRLCHRVAFADGDAVVFKRIEVNGNAIWSVDFVLTAVSLADRCGRAEVASEVLGKLDIQFFRFFVELFLQGEHRNLYRCDCVMQVKHDVGVVFADLLFVVCVTPNGNETRGASTIK